MAEEQLAVVALEEQVPVVDEQADRIVVVEPNGDVVLVCGKDTERSKCRIQVASAFLRKASPVFTSMLAADRFREGATLGTDGAVEIELPDDKGDCMSFGSPSPLQLVEIARLVDKYDLASSTRLVMGYWLSRPLGKDDDDGRQQLLVAAYLAQHAGCFTEVSKSIVLRNTEEVCGVEGLDVPEIMGTVFVTLEEQRVNAQKSLTSTIDAFIERQVVSRAPNVCGKRCAYQDLRLRAVMESLRHNLLWPVSRRDARSIGSNIKIMRNTQLITLDLQGA